MATKIAPGKYAAKIVDYGVGETKSGNVQVMILLEYNDLDGDRHEITWFGSLKEGKAQEITIETLLKCGLRGNDLAPLGDGVRSGLLDVESSLTIAVIEHEYEGKKSMRVQWISNQGGGALDKKLSAGEAKSKLGALNLRGAVVAVRKDTGIVDDARKPAIPYQREPGDDFNDVFGPA